MGLIELGCNNNPVSSQSGFTNFKEQLSNRDDNSLAQCSLRVNWTTSIHEPFEFRVKLDREGVLASKVLLVPDLAIQIKVIVIPEFLWCIIATGSAPTRAGPTIHLKPFIYLTTPGLAIVLPFQMLM
jgi:hypothetical protein